MGYYEAQVNLMNKKHKIFLLSPIDDENLCILKLIWNDDEESAREYALIQLAHEISEGDQTSLLKESIYEDPSQVSCKQLKEGKDYTILPNRVWDNQIDIKLMRNNKNYSLPYDHAVDF